MANKPVLDRPEDYRHPMTSTYDALIRYREMASREGKKPTLTGRIEMAETRSQWYRLVEGTGWVSPDAYIASLTPKRGAAKPPEVVAKLMADYPAVLLHESAMYGQSSSDLSVLVLRTCVKIIETLYDHPDLKRGKWTTAKLDGFKRVKTKTDNYDPFSQREITYAIMFEDVDMAALVKLHL